MRTTGIVIAVIIGLSVLVAGIWTFRYFTAPIEGKVSAEEQINSAETRIYSYEHFYDLCATIQGNETAINTQKQALKSAESVDERSRIRANIAGLVAQRARNIAQYNQDARKHYTIARFKDHSLPQHLSTKEETSCVR